jgi:hypothetical protein
MVIEPNFAAQRWAASLEWSMSEPTLERLNETERTCVDHLRQAQVLGVSFAEYCRSFDLDLSKWYRVKQALARKGITVAGMAVSVAEVSNVDAVAEEKAAPFARVQIEAAPVAPMTAPPVGGTVGVACRIVHPSGWIVECGVLPQASWLAAVLAGQHS